MRTQRRLTRPVSFLLFLVLSLCVSGGVFAQSGTSTRIEDAKMHHRSGSKSYPYRARKDYVLAELDLKPGDIVVDIGAGDGWWSEHLARAVGEKGIVHAAEVEKKKVEGMKTRFAKTTQVHPYVCDKDSTKLDENSCDLAFFSQSFHHLDLKERVDYLRHLKSVVKPTGRLVIIEKYSQLASQGEKHGTNLSVLASEAESAGWVVVRYELMVGTYHYVAILVQKDLFPPQKKGKGKGKRKRVRL